MNNVMNQKGRKKFRTYMVWVILVPFYRDSARLSDLLGVTERKGKGEDWDQICWTPKPVFALAVYAVAFNYEILSYNADLSEHLGSLFALIG